MSPSDDFIERIRNGQVPGLKFNSFDLKEIARNKPAVNIFRAEAHSISNWADFGFTADGREFGLLDIEEPEDDESEDEN